MSAEYKFSEGSVHKKLEADAACALANTYSKLAELVTKYPHNDDRARCAIISSLQDLTADLEKDTEALLIPSITQPLSPQD